MSRSCQQCGNGLPDGARFCESCGTLVMNRRIVDAFDYLKFSERLQSLRDRFPVDPLQFHLLTTIMVGLLAAMVFSPLDLTHAESYWAGFGRFLGGLLLATLVAFFPIGYLVRGQWPLIARLDAALGDNSALRAWVYAVGLQFLLLIASGPLPGLDQLATWLATLLFGSLILFFPVGFWLTGALPLSGPVQRILGEEFSLRRRLILAAFVSLPFVGGFEEMSRVVAAFIVAYYLMGHASNWRQVASLNQAIELAELEESVGTIKDQTREGMSEVGLEDLHISEIDLARTDLFGSGQRYIRQGYQLVFTLNRARVTVFVHNFGRDLFASTVVHCDVSGRRLWLLIGFMLSFLDSMTIRWFGSSWLRYSSLLRGTLTPASRFRNRSYAADPIGSYFAKLFGLLEALPQTDWNDLQALHGAVSNQLMSHLQNALAIQGSEVDVESRLRLQMATESLIGGPAAAAQAMPAIAGRRA